ncbi:MAG TPA: PAS domain S-box protein [Terriglobales bacterium]|nr:PAS domain S-box protein [Terriglobales bacterium]
MSSPEVAAALDLFEVAPCGYLFTLPDGTLTKANQTFLNWTGYAAEDLLQRKRLQELFTRPAAIFYETHFAPLLRMQGFVKEITVDFVCANGSILSALVNSNIHRDHAGEPLLILTTVFDIRERRQYERELLLERQRAEQWASVVANTSEAIMTADAQAKLTSWNRGAESLFGYTPAEAAGKDFRELLVYRAEVKQWEEILRELRAGQSLQRDMILCNKNGDLIAASVSLTPQIEPVAEFTGFAAIVQDLRARIETHRTQQMVRDLERANQLAHEINNPLQAIVNCMALVSATGGAEYIRSAEENLDRIAAVIKRLVNVTRK